MTIVTLEENAVRVLRTLASPLLHEDSTLTKVWTILMKTQLAFLLYVDMVTHIYAILFLNENWIEGTLTIAFFFGSNFFTYPLIPISTAKSISWKPFFMLIGLYDLKRYLDQSWADRRLRQYVKPYMAGEELLTVRALQTVYGVKFNQVLDETVNFRRTIMDTLPLVVLKIYFGYMDTSHCSIGSVIRIFVILLGLYESTKTCLAQETSLTEFLKTGILLDMGLDCQQQDFNPNMPTGWTRAFDFLAIMTSIVYRVYACAFYLLISPLVGLLQILSALVISVSLHLRFRPVYENPPIAVATLSYDIVEVVAKLFLVRTSRLYKSSTRVQGFLLFAWSFGIIVEHFGSLYLTHIILGGMVGRTNDTVACPGWLSVAFEVVFDAMSPNRFLMGEGLLDAILLNYPVFTVLFLLTLVVNGGHLIYLGRKGLNDPQFPVVAACHIWSKRFFKRLQKLSGPNVKAEQLEWVKKLMVLTLLTREEFKSYMPAVANCGALKSTIVWKVLVFKKEGALPPPELPEIGFRLRQDHIMREELIEFIQNVYSMNTGAETETYRKLAYLVCVRFVSLMANMDSRRILLTCQLLGVNPIVKSPFLKLTKHVPGSA